MRKAVKTDHCLNCNTKIDEENYCPECGQRNDAVLPGLGDFIYESFSNFFAYDGKFFKTLGHLFRYPGRVAREFINGKRATYMPPVRIYFLSSILLLFIMSLRSNEETIFQKKETAEKEAISETLSDHNDKKTGPEYLRNRNLYFKFKILYVHASDHPNASTSEVLNLYGLENNWFNQFLYDRAYKAAMMDDKDFSKYFFSKMFWVLFLFLPFFAASLKLIYIRRKILYLEHLFFAFYTQSAFFILLIFSLIFTLFVKIDNLLPITISIFLIYLWFALKGFYNQSILKTTIKFILINISYSLFFISFLLLALLISFIFY